MNDLDQLMSAYPLEGLKPLFPALRKQEPDPVTREAALAQLLRSVPGRETGRKPSELLQLLPVGYRFALNEVYRLKGGSAAVTDGSDLELCFLLFRWLPKIEIDPKFSSTASALNYRLSEWEARYRETHLRIRQMMETDPLALAHDFNNAGGNLALDYLFMAETEPSNDPPKIHGDERPFHENFDERLKKALTNLKAPAAGIFLRAAWMQREFLRTRVRNFKLGADFPIECLDLFEWQPQSIRPKINSVPYQGEELRLFDALHPNFPGASQVKAAFHSSFVRTRKKMPEGMIDQGPLREELYLESCFATAGTMDVLDAFQKKITAEFGPNRLPYLMKAIQDTKASIKELFATRQAISEQIVS